MSVIVGAEPVGAIGRLIAEFGKLPGIGPKTAERLTHHLLAADRSEVLALAEALPARRFVPPEGLFEPFAEIDTAVGAEGCDRLAGLRVERVEKAAIGDEHAIVPRRTAFFDHMFHVPRRNELAFLDVHRPFGHSCRDY